jgi:hypothetical protein
VAPNKHLPHVLVLPEDDANRQLANGFLLEIPFTAIRQVQVLEEAGGWTDVLDRFDSDHVARMDRYPNTHMVLLFDFDRDEDRLIRAQARIPARLRDRVFVLGAWGEPEDLRQNLGSSYETIGRKMAADCRDGTEVAWAHGLLRHNAGELERLRASVRPILFPAC